MTSDTFLKIEMWNLSKDNENPLGATSQGRGCTVECCVTSAKHCKRWEINQDEKDEMNIQKTEAFKSDAGPAVPNAAKNFFHPKSLNNLSWLTVHFLHIFVFLKRWPGWQIFYWYDQKGDEFQIFIGKYVGQILCCSVQNPSNLRLMKNSIHWINNMTTGRMQ